MRKSFRKYPSGGRAPAGHTAFNSLNSATSGKPAHGAGKMHVRAAVIVLAVMTAVMCAFPYAAAAVTSAGGALVSASEETHGAVGQSGHTGGAGAKDTADTSAGDGSSYETVKVGYYYSRSFQEGIGDDTMKSGFGYEYIQKIASYTGWKYDYVYGSWNDLYEKLLSGKIAIMADTM